jgi:hypothetical protein
MPISQHRAERNLARMRPASGKAASYSTAATGGLPSALTAGLHTPIDALDQADESPMVSALWETYLARRQHAEAFAQWRGDDPSDAIF